MPLTYTLATEQDLHLILRLQKQNLKEKVSIEEQREQGFVTVDHDYALLLRMNSPHPHIVAKVGDDVVGYCLVMLPNLKMDIPVLVPMFELIEKLSYQNVPIIGKKYFIMGQVCVDKKYRGKGVFYGMYNYMKTTMIPFFDYIITEVSSHNPRSLKAHYNQGFEALHEYIDPEGHPWVAVIWKMKNED